MNTSKKQTDIKQDAPKWFVVLLLTAAVFFVNYKGSSLPGAVLSIAWVIWFVLSLAVIYFTQLGQQGLNFVQDARQELLKVVWPTRQEIIQMTAIIMVVVLIVSLLLWAVDSSLLWLVGKLTSLK